MPELFRKCCRRRTSVRPRSKLRPLTPTLPPIEARPSKASPQVAKGVHVLTSSGQSQWVVHLAPRHDPCAATSLPWCNGSSCMPDESRHQRIDALDIAHPPRQLSTPRPRQVRGLRLSTECYSTKPYVVCPRSRKLRFIYGLPVHSKKVCVVPCISSLRPSLAVRSGGLSRPPIRCQRPRAYTQLAHTRVVGVARISQPRPARVAIVGRLACAACLRSVLPTAGTCVALNLFSRPPR